MLIWVHTFLIFLSSSSFFHEKDSRERKAISFLLTVVSFYLFWFELIANGAQSEQTGIAKRTRERTEKRTEWKIWYYSVNWQNKPVNTVWCVLLFVVLFLVRVSCVKTIEKQQKQKTKQHAQTQRRLNWLLHSWRNVLLIILCCGCWVRLHSHSFKRVC